MTLEMHNTPIGTVEGYDLKWRDGEFYASNYNSPCGTLEDGEEYWDELRFNIREIKPR